MGFLDARGNHADPQVALTERGAAIVATRVGPRGQPARAISVASRRGPAGRWAPPRRFAARGSTAHRVALNERQDALVVWTGTNGIRSAHRRGPLGAWTSDLVPGASGQEEILAAHVREDGYAHLVVRRTDGYAASVRVATTGRWTPLADLGLPRDAEVLTEGVAFAPELLVAARHRSGRVVVAAFPDGRPERAVLAEDAISAPQLAATRGRSAAAWLAADRRVQLGFWARERGWSLNGADSRAIEGSVRVTLSPRGAALAQWRPETGPVGGAYRAVRRGAWQPTAAAWGRGFLRHRSAFFAEPGAEGLRKRLGLPQGPLQDPAATLEVVHADDRGDVFAVLTSPDGGDFAMLRRRAGATTPWRPAAIAGVGGARPTVAANRRGDVLAAFLSPSEFVDGDLNSAVASFAPSLRLGGPVVAAGGQRIAVRVVAPDRGALRLRLTTPQGRVVSSRQFGIARGTRIVRLSAPRRADRYQVRAVLRTADGRGYLARRGLRVR